MYCERYIYNCVDDLWFGKSCKILDWWSGFVLLWEVIKEYLFYVSNLFFSVGFLFFVLCGCYFILIIENLFWNRVLFIVLLIFVVRFELVCVLNIVIVKLIILNKIVFYLLYYFYYLIGNFLIVKLFGWEIFR